MLIKKDAYFLLPFSVSCYARNTLYYMCLEAELTKMVLQLTQAKKRDGSIVSRVLLCFVVFTPCFWISLLLLEQWC